MKVNYQSHDHEHEFEAAHGLPEPLPQGERLLWQGSPDWRTLAVEAFHIRKLALYFALMLAWRLVERWPESAGLGDALWGTLPMFALASIALGLTATIAWLSAHTSVYTITDRRVVMRIGIVLTVTFNLPLTRIEAASLHRLSSGHGDLALVLGDDEQIAYLHLWPHARPWRVKRSEPMLRSLPEVDHVANLLASSLAASAGQTRSAIPTAAASRDTVHGGKPMLAA